MVNSIKLDLKEKMLENRFNYIVDYDYETEYSCEDSGCNSEGICRCGRIYNVEVTPVDMMKLTTHIYESLVDDSKAGKRQQKLNQLFYGGEVVDKYCINRILSHYKLYESKNWEVEIEGGYYGDEIGDVTMNGIVFDLVQSECYKLMELETLSDKIKSVLSLEYGYLLPDLESANFEIIDISQSDIDFKSLNQNHIRLVKEEKESNGLNHYNSSSYDLPRGVVRKLGDNYKIVDGFHRMMASEALNFKVFYVKN
jgi:hypothetical protein